jgi:hypothetical protein
MAWKFRRPIAILAVGCLGVSYAFKKHLDNRFTSTYNAMFPKLAGWNENCIGRKEFRKKLQDDLDAQSWNGIIFISGRIQMGKSTAIMSVLQGRKYVAYVDLVDQNLSSLTSSDKLNEKLKGAFNLNLISEDFFKTIYYLTDNLPDATIEVSTSRIDQTLRLIRIILYSMHAKKMPRPVICIEGIGALETLLTNEETKQPAELFLNWLVYTSVDLQLCDVIVVDNNGWAVENLLDPIYIRSLVLEDMDSADIDEILKDMPRELRDHRQAQELLNDVGGHGMHLIRLARSKSLEEMQSTYQELLLTEAKSLQNLYDSCQPCPWSLYLISCIWGNKRLEVCVEKREIDAILEAFLRRVRDGNGDPKVHVNRLAHEAKVSVRTLKYLGTKNLLYWNPVEQTVSVRNKLLLRVCQLKKQKAAEAAELERAMGKYIVILNPIPIMVDGKNVARVPSPDERAEAERQLKLIEEKLAFYDSL